MDVVFSPLLHDSVYGCQLCDISMSNPKELGLHMRYHHRPKRGSSLHLKDSEQVVSVVDGKDPSGRNRANNSSFSYTFLQMQPKRRKIQRNIVKSFHVTTIKERTMNSFCCFGMYLI